MKFIRKYLSNEQECCCSKYHHDCNYLWAMGTCLPLNHRLAGIWNSSTIASRCDIAFVQHRGSGTCPTRVENVGRKSALKNVDLQTNLA